MAFPASPSDNEVHKEGNRSFVYDSTLGAWDRVQDIDRLDPSVEGAPVSSSLGLITDATLGEGSTITRDVTFPAGSVIQCKVQMFNATAAIAVNGAWVSTPINVNIVPKSSNSTMVVQFNTLWGSGTDFNGGLAIHRYEQDNDWSGTRVMIGQTVSATNGQIYASNAMSYDNWSVGVTDHLNHIILGPYEDSTFPNEAISYRVFMYTSNSQTLYMNRPTGDTSARGTMSGIVWEVEGRLVGERSHNR